jgi:hypothetical protein
MSAPAAGSPPFDFTHLPRAFLDGVIWVLTRVILQQGHKVTTAWTPRNTKADPGNPATWTTFTDASATLERNPKLFDGLAIVLGNSGTGAYRVALALRNCIDEHGNVAGWAERIRIACPTYTERTGSGHGLRMFFTAAAEVTRAAPALFGYPANQSSCHRIVGTDGAAITISFANGIARATGRVLADQQSDVAEIDLTMLERLARLVVEVTGKPANIPPKPAPAPLQKRQHLEADREQIAQFVNLLFRYADEGTFASLRIFDQFDPGKPALHVVGKPVDGDNAAIIDAAVRTATRAATMTEPAVFSPPVATFTTAAKARGIDLASGLAIAVELDDGDIETGRDGLEQLLGPATVVVASGGTTAEGVCKLHVYWRLSEPTRAADEHARLTDARRNAALLIGADVSGAPPASIPVAGQLAPQERSAGHGAHRCRQSECRDQPRRGARAPAGSGGGGRAA